MREIKFRAYLKSKKEFVYTDDWKDLGKFGWHNFLITLGEENGYTPELQQFTGLKDKNGKEIYEGDIVKFKIYPEFQNEKEVDIFDEIEFRGGCFILKNRIELLRTRLPNIEVIGNVFENT